VRRLCGEHGFGVEAIDSGVIRKNGETDILGHLVVLRQGRASG
jgi:hypothetical protein